MEVLFNRGTSTPRKISGTLTRIAFHGEGEARFVLQHTRDEDGKPDELSWVDVSGMSDGSIDQQDEVTGFDYKGAPKRWLAYVRRPVLVDRVNGNVDVLYRRHIAEWLRVIPMEESGAVMVRYDRVTGKTEVQMKQGNGGCCHPCGAYLVTMEADDGKEATRPS